MSERIRIKIKNRYGYYEVAPLHAQYVKSGRIVIDGVHLSSSQIKRIIAKFKKNVKDDDKGDKGDDTTTTAATTTNNNSDIGDNGDTDSDDGLDGLNYIDDYEPDMSNAYWTDFYQRLNLLLQSTQVTNAVIGSSAERV